MDTLCMDPTMHWGAAVFKIRVKVNSTPAPFVFNRKTKNSIFQGPFIAAIAFVYSKPRQNYGLRKKVPLGKVALFSIAPFTLQAMK